MSEVATPQLSLTKHNLETLSHRDEPAHKIEERLEKIVGIKVDGTPSERNENDVTERSSRTNASTTARTSVRSHTNRSTARSVLSSKRSWAPSSSRTDRSAIEDEDFLYTDRTTLSDLEEGWRTLEILRSEEVMAKDQEEAEARRQKIIAYREVLEEQLRLQEENLLKQKKEEDIQKVLELRKIEEMKLEDRAVQEKQFEEKKRLKDENLSIMEHLRVERQQAREIELAEGRRLAEEMARDIEHMKDEHKLEMAEKHRKLDELTINREKAIQAKKELARKTAEEDAKMFEEYCDYLSRHEREREAALQATKKRSEINKDLFEMHAKKADDEREKQLQASLKRAQEELEEKLRIDEEKRKDRQALLQRLQQEHLKNQLRLKEERREQDRAEDRMFADRLAADTRLYEAEQAHDRQKRRAQQAEMALQLEMQQKEIDYVNKQSKLGMTPEERRLNKEKLKRAKELRRTLQSTGSSKTATTQPKNGEPLGQTTHTIFR